MSGIPRAAVCFQMIGGVLYNTVMYIPDLLFHKALPLRCGELPCTLHNGGHFGLMLADGRLHLILACEALDKIIVRPPGAEIRMIISSPVPGHSEGKIGKIHIKDIRIVRIKGVSCRSHG